MKSFERCRDFYDVANYDDHSRAVTVVLLNELSCRLRAIFIATNEDFQNGRSRFVGVPGNRNKQCQA